MIKTSIKILSCLLVCAWLIVMYQHKFGTRNTTALIPGLVVVGTTSNQAPLMFWHQGRSAGFEPELVQEIGKRLGKKMIIRHVPSSSLIAALRNGDIHLAIIAGTSLDNEKNLIFSQPYCAHAPHSSFALAHHNILLLQHLDATLEELKEDGSLTALHKKWQLF